MNMKERVETLNREVKAAMTKHVGKKLTPELEKEIKEEIGEVIFENGFNKELDVAIKNGRVFLVNKKNQKIVLLDIALTISFLLLMMFINKAFTIATGVLIAAMFLLNWLAKRDLKKINAEKLGMTVKELEEMESKHPDVFKKD